VRIAHIITRLLRAGSEENTLLTSAGQMAAGHEVFILHGRDAKPAYARAMAPGVALVEIPALERELSPRRDSSAFRHIRRTLRDLRPDVVHTHQSKAGILGRFAAASVGTRAVIHGVHILPFLAETGPKRAIYLNAEKLAARVTDAFIHVSEGTMASYDDHKVGRGKVHRIVYSGFDIQRFVEAEPPEAWRELLGVPEDVGKPPVVLMLASLEERKQHLELIERLPPLLRQFPDARVVFAGEGNLSDRIGERIASLALESRVKLLGYRDDPERVIAMADVCILCSKREGLPRSVMQYLAGGRPSVVFQVEGIERLIRDGHNGVVVGQGDWDGLMAGVSGILGDPIRRETLSRHAGATDLSSWDSSFMAGRTLAVYAEVSAVLATRGHRRPARTG
jgi:glycosyltransferase involved in cell wall biosynthesis